MLKRLWQKLTDPTPIPKDQNAGLVLLFGLGMVVLLAPLVWHQFIPRFDPEEKTQELALLSKKFESYQDSLKTQRKKKWALEHPSPRPEPLEAYAAPKKQQSKNATPNSKPYTPKARHLFDLNTATQEDLVQVKGIGVYFAKRILKFRESLGGFYAAHQLYQVYHLDSAVVLETFEHLKPNSDWTVQTLNPNTQEFKVLLKHPYLDYPAVKQIFNNRPISDENLCEVLPLICQKVRPYFRY